MAFSELRQLMAHAEWADAVVWDAVLATPAARADAVLQGRLHHLHTVQWVYLNLWREQPLELREPAAFDDAAALRDWARDFHAAAGEWLGSLGEPALRRRVRFPWADDWRRRGMPMHPATVAQSILQVASHSSYHRGQVNADLRRLGGEPPLVDFIAWVWQGQPPAGWGGAPDRPAAADAPAGP